MSTDDQFEPVLDRLRPSPATRVRSGVGLVLLLTFLGLLAGLVAVIAIVLSVLALNNAL